MKTRAIKNVATGLYLSSMNNEPEWVKSIDDAWFTSNVMSCATVLGILVTDYKIKVNTVSVEHE